MTNILVTGGAGAIGSNLVKQLIQEPDIQITVVDNLSSGRRENLPTHIDFVEGDISDDRVLARVFDKQFIEIYHLAGFFANQNSYEHPIEDFRTNALGTVMLMDAASKQQQLRSFLYASTSSLEPEIATSSIDGFSTPYMASKYVGELYSSFYRRERELPIRLVRYFNGYGPGELPGRYRNVVINFIDAALRGDPLVITGDGGETRDFTYIDDLVTGSIAIARSEKTLGHVYQIGTGLETSVLELADLIKQIAGSNSSVRHESRRSWDKTTRRFADISLAQQHVGYSPSVELASGLRRTIDWYRTISRPS